MITLRDYDWWCDDCGASLDAQDAFDVNCGSWACTKCGCINFINENEIVDFNSGDEEYSDSIDIEEYYFRHRGETPEACAACGGPYPNCTSSCPLFDD